MPKQNAQKALVKSLIRLLGDSMSPDKEKRGKKSGGSKPKDGKPPATNQASSPAPDDVPLTDAEKQLIRKAKKIMSDARGERVDPAVDNALVKDVKGYVGRTVHRWLYVYKAGKQVKTETPVEAFKAPPS